MMNNLKFVLRQLRKSPGFTVIAVMTIALGIGATTAIFSVVDATLLQPLPYPHPEQLVSIQDDLAGLGASDVGMSQPEWQDLQQSGILPVSLRFSSVLRCSPATFPRAAPPLSIQLRL
jgi:putative ABC transport system permease protein